MKKDFYFYFYFLFRDKNKFLLKFRDQNSILLYNRRIVIRDDCVWGLIDQYVMCIILIIWHLVIDQLLYCRDCIGLIDLIAGDMLPLTWVEPESEPSQTDQLVRSLNTFLGFWFWFSCIKPGHSCSLFSFVFHSPHPSPSYCCCHPVSPSFSKSLPPPTPPAHALPITNLCFRPTL